MNNFFKLLSFELNRFIKLYIALMITIIVIQITGTIVETKKYMVLVNNNVYKNGMSEQAFFEMYSPFNFIEVVYSLWILGPIALGVALLLIYVFFIWYRDWFAKNTFIYRLFMLPTSRMNIFFAKAVMIMLTVLGLVGLQIVLLFIETKIVQWTIPKSFRIDVTISEITSGVYHLSYILPGSFTEFVIHYALGFAFLVVIFTAILFERSFKLKGLLLGIVYVICMLGLFILPFIIQLIIFDTFYLYPAEMFFVELFIWIFVTVCSLFISRYLLNHKVTV